MNCNNETIKNDLLKLSKQYVNSVNAINTSMNDLINTINNNVINVNENQLGGTKNLYRHNNESSESPFNNDDKYSNSIMRSASKNKKTSKNKKSSNNNKKVSRKTSKSKSKKKSKKTSRGLSEGMKKYQELLSFVAEKMNVPRIPTIIGSFVKIYLEQAEKTTTDSSKKFDEAKKIFLNDFNKGSAKEKYNKIAEEVKAKKKSKK
jgi:hypothetical protein